MTIRRNNQWGDFIVAIAVIMAAPAAAAQTSQPAPTSQGVANPFQGFSQNSGQPVKIESTSLEVRDKDNKATFIGDVHVTQGDTSIRCKTLVVFYDQSSAPGAAKTQQGGSGRQQKIRRLEAKGDVVVVQKDQTATGDNGLFDLKTNTVTLTGNVVVTQGQNVVRGEKLVVDLTTGLSRVEAGKSSKGRVEGLFVPGSQPNGPPASAPSAPHDARAPAGAKSPPPLRLN